MPQTLPALGIDIGGGSAKIGIVSPHGELLARDVVASEPNVGAPALIGRYLAMADRMRKSLGIEGFCGIGIGLPGHIDFKRGTTRLGNVPCLDDFPIVDFVSKKSGSMAYIENDATLAALAECRIAWRLAASLQGAGAGSRSLRPNAQGLATGTFTPHVVSRCANATRLCRPR